MYPGRYDRGQLKERVFQGMHPHLRDSMRFLYMKEEVGYEEFWAAVYEAETEGTEGKVLNVMAKAMTVEKVVDKNEPTDLQDIKQQDRVISYDYEEYYSRKCKIKGRRRGAILKKEGRVSKLS